MKNEEQKRAWRTFAIVNGAALAAAAVAYPLILWLGERLGSFCALHDILHIYCPTCGATRATWALLHGQIVTALRCHAAVVVIYAALAVIDLRALVLLCRGSTRPYAVRPIVWWGMLGLFLLYFVLRNVSLVFFRWDWVGDFIRSV